MSWLAPLFLLGALAVGAPVIAHLVRRSARERVRFSATQFLEPSIPRLSRRNRIEHPWLLVLRCLIVALIATAFARPFLRDDQPLAARHSPPRRVIAVLDESASMQRHGLTPAAHGRILDLAQHLDTEDHFALIGTNRPGTPILSADRWSSTLPDERTSLLQTLLEQHPGGWGTTPLDLAIDTAIGEAEAMSEAGGGVAPTEIAIFSDLNTGVRVSGLAGRDWPEEIHVTLEDLNANSLPNAAIHLLGWSQSPAGTPVARLLLSQDGANASQVTLRLQNATTREPAGEPRTLLLAPEERRLVLWELPENVPHLLRLDLQGDDEPFDNTVWMIPPRRPELGIVVIGEAGEAPTAHAEYYIAHAADSIRTFKTTTTIVNPATASALPDAALFVVDTVPSEGLTRSLAVEVKNGAFALVLARDTALARLAGQLIGESDWNTKSYAQPDALLAEIDFRHPLFSPFADPHFSDFTHVRFWQPSPLVVPEDSQASIAARFEDRSPAVTEASLGQGAVITWGGGWTPQAGQWVLSSKFVPWLDGVLARAAGGSNGPDSIEAGSDTKLLSDPQSTWTPVAPTTAPPPDHAPVAPGIYRLTQHGQTRPIAVQVPAVESESSPLPLDTWERLGVPMTENERTASERTQAQPGRNATQLENDQKLWRWLLFATAVLLAIESLSAIAAAHRGSPTTPAPQSE